MKTIALLCLTLASSWAHSFDLSGTMFDRVGKEFNIDPVLLYSIALAESAYSTNNDGFIAPNPWTLRTNQPFYGQNLQQTKSELERVLSKTDHVDIGLMQINYFWHKDKIKSPYALLDAETNLRVAAKILKTALRSSPKNLPLAVGRYHSYHPERSQQYGLTVLHIFHQLKED